MFPRWIFDTMIVGSLALTALGVVVLLTLLVRDMRGKRIW